MMLSFFSSPYLSQRIASSALAPSRVGIGTRLTNARKQLHTAKKSVYMSFVKSHIRIDAVPVARFKTMPASDVTASFL